MLHSRKIRLLPQGRSPAEIFHLARLLEDAVNPLISMLSGGTLDLSALSMPEETPLLGCAALIFKGTLTSNQFIVMPNRIQWWSVQNAMAGAFTLEFKTPTGEPSDAIPQNSAWQLVQCDGKTDGAEAYRAACQLGCEGIVSKKLGTPYRSGRSDTWPNTKNLNAPAATRVWEEDWGR